jgi:hypothetical protein
MNAEAIIDKFENLISDSLDADFTLQLANDAMHEIEEEVRPEGLKAVDTSNSTTAGQTYTTAFDLPTDFFLPAPFIYVGSERYYQIPFERAVEYRDTTGFYYIDTANAEFHLCGTQTSSQTITFPYFYATADLVITPSPTSPAWPAQFHSLIPLRMAEMYFAIDGGERGRSWDDQFGKYYQQRLNRFKDYDAKLKLAGMDRSSAPIDNPRPSENGIDI